MSEILTDNRFELIEKYKQELINATNIEDDKKEMAAIDNILFRFWQMGWLDKLEESDAGMTVAEYRARMIEAFHNADCDSLISVVVLPIEKEFQFLEWLLKNEYIPFLEKAKRHGKWEQTEVVHECFDIQGFKTWGIKCTCDRCGFKTIAIEGHFAQYKYCPQCGARMDEEND